jgi:hypothetical protein
MLRFDVLAVGSINIAIFREVTSCGLVNGYHISEESVAPSKNIISFYYAFVL